MRPHILLAEDDADTREILQLILDHAGFQVSVTGDSSEVMQLLAANSFDALLLDNWMPNLNGIELCRLIRARDSSIPIFFCSGAVTEADKQAAFSAGAQGYVAKPFDPDELTAVLRAALKVVQT
ncbi:MAG TPA: response regulator [Pyrinomonadaceae bacterium]|jgi:two-component system response regulator MprA|nr:response regulator [Pyrinomonadaceae bacterium]